MSLIEQSLGRMKLQYWLRIGVMIETEDEDEDGLTEEDNEDKNDTISIGTISGSIATGTPLGTNSLKKPSP